MLLNKPDISLKYIVNLSGIYLIKLGKMKRKMKDELQNDLFQRRVRNQTHSLISWEIMGEIKVESTIIIAQTESFCLNGSSIF